MFHKLELCDIDNIPVTKVLINAMKKYKIKHSLSNSEKSFNIHSCFALAANKMDLYQLSDLIITSCENVSLSSKGTSLKLTTRHYLRLVIEHDIKLDLFEDLTQEETDYLDKLFRDNTINHKIIENNIYKIFCQKCDLPGEIIHELIELISFGSKPEPVLTMYESDKYSITQITDYRRALIESNSN